MSSDQHHIDQLLQRYLLLLDEYTQLRAALSKIQSDVYHNIARANFAGERGMRYGQDQYDGRMTASRRVGITKNDDEVVQFAVTGGTTSQHSFEDDNASEQEKPASKEDVAGDGDGSFTVQQEEETKEKEKEKETSNDPLRWFGILTPMPLRAAQGHSIKLVEDVIPRLVSVNAEMQHLEIEVRRARKRRAKAESAKSRGEGMKNEGLPAVNC